jgi:hypothetical protein
MLAHYSHVRTQANRTAPDALSTRRAEMVNVVGFRGGHDTNNDAKPQTEAEGYSQVIESMVELVGIEPTTSSLRTMRSPSCSPFEIIHIH